MPSLIVWGDSSGRQAILPNPVADIECDVDPASGTFQVQSPARAPAGGWLSVPGTCFGGWIDSVSTTSGSADYTYTGKTWLGLLTDRIVTPPAGQTNLVVSGDLADVVKTLLLNVGLTTADGVADWVAGAPFNYVNGKTGITVPSTSIDRYVSAAVALTKVLAAINGAGRVWVVETDTGLMFNVAAVNNPRLISGIDTGVSMTYKTSAPVNHLIGLGKGEGVNREIVHRYADANGEVSATQTLKGLAEHQATYELSDKSGAELAAGVEAKLRSLQVFGTATITYSGGAGMLYPGDAVTVVDPPHGITATATIQKAIFKLDDTGAEQVTWQTQQ